MDPTLPSNVINKCPAIMFADNRIAKVPGRIMFLIDSIHTIKGISNGGVPCGTKCANINDVLLIHPNNIKVNHRGKAILKEILKCLVLVKIYGNNPRKLLIIINKNILINIKVLPFDFLVRIFNSLCM